MMVSLRVGNVTVQFDHDGDRNFNKAGSVDWLGKPVLIPAGSYTFHFDLEGRIQRIDGFASPHSWDWLQRTMANDWIYYDKVWAPGSIPQPSGIIGDAVWAVNGRTDLPMLQGHNGLQRDYVGKAFDAFDGLISSIQDLVKHRPEVHSESGEAAHPTSNSRLWDFLGKAARNDRVQLQKVADRLHEIHGHMAVLPPDTINVDYRTLLVKVMDGCTYTCGFCLARGESEFAVRSRDDIDRQIDVLAEVYGADLYNYNSVVFGECDALTSPSIEYAANRAFDVFRCGSSFHAGSNLFLFSTTRTLCEQPDSTFDMLEALPFENVWINVGWEAATNAALLQLEKQQTAQEVLSGMEKAGKINRKHKKVKISGNFITADGYQCDGIVEAIRRTQYCGQLFLSPLLGQCSSEQALKDLRAIRNASPDVRAHLYTMQRM
jgi:hypothetical protein